MKSNLFIQLNDLIDRVHATAKAEGISLAAKHEIPSAGAVLQQVLKAAHGGMGHLTAGRPLVAAYVLGNAHNTLVITRLADASVFAGVMEQGFGEPPPPANIEPLPAEIVLVTGCAHCHRPIARFFRNSYLPPGPAPQNIVLPKLPEIDRLFNLGVHIRLGVDGVDWDYELCHYAIHLVPTFFDPTLSAETLGLMFGMLKTAGWRMVAVNPDEPIDETWSRHQKVGDRWPTCDDDLDPDLDDEDEDEDDEP